MCLVIAGPSATRADVTREQRETISAIKIKARKARNLAAQKKYDEAAALTREAQAEYEKLLTGAEEDLVRQAKSAFEALERAHALLELYGVELKPLKAAEMLAPKSEGVSFVKQVAPLLIAKCGRCHVNNARGGVSMANYDVLMKGGQTGIVVFPNDPVGSRLIESIKEGEMPRGGIKVEEAELKLLTQWVTEGAKFDGKDKTTPLATLAPDAQADRPATVEVAMATGKESVPFLDAVAPIFLEHCAGCHGGQRPGGNLDMTTFRQLLRGGDGGPPVLPGKPEESFLIKKLRGTGGGERMPRGRDPLPEATIAKLETWIREGATFDGGDATVGLARLVDVANARKASHTELSASREELATQNWSLGMPGINHSHFQNQDVYLVSNMGSQALAEIGQRTEQVVEKLKKILRAPDSQPLVKGRVTLYLFQQRYDYSEFGKMVQQREVPRGEQSHWRYDVVDAYGALLVPRSDDLALDGLIAHQLAGAYFASFGEAPLWFTDGLARATVARVVPDDPRIQQWNEQLPAALRQFRKPDDLVKGQLPLDAAEVARYSLGKFLLSNQKSLQAMLKGLQEGLPFEQLFVSVYRGTPAQVSQLWLRQAGR